MTTLINSGVAIRLQCRNVTFNVFVWCLGVKLLKNDPRNTLLPDILLFVFWIHLTNTILNVLPLFYVDISILNLLFVNREVCWPKNYSSVIRQKGESQNGCFNKTKHAKFSEKQTFLTSWYTDRKIWRAFFSWNTHFEILPFALLPTKQVFLVAFSLFPRFPPK